VILKSEKGFSLLEVMIAVGLFAIFVTAFQASQGKNISASAKMKDELTLLSLAETLINQKIIDPPEYNEALANAKETKAFEIEGYENYIYTVSYKKFEVPDFQKLMGALDTDKKNEEREQLETQQSVMLKNIIFTNLKENMEKILWQLQVEVKNNNTERSIVLTSWVTNTLVPVQLNLGGLGAAAGALQ